MSEQEIQTVQVQKPQKYYDERYIQAYTDNPIAGKKAALEAAGYIGDYAAQEAHRIHKRLASKIRDIIESRAVEGISVGHKVMMDLAINDEVSASVRGTMAKGLIEYGESIQAVSNAGKQVQTIEEIESELALLEAQG